MVRAEAKQFAPGNHCRLAYDIFEKFNTSLPYTPLIKKFNSKFLYVVVLLRPIGKFRLSFSDVCIVCNSKTRYTVNHVVYNVLTSRRIRFQDTVVQRTDLPGILPEQYELCWLIHLLPMHFRL